jgi:hypothetical protein
VRAQVPDFKWHIIEDRVPFEIADTGIMVTPFQGRSAPACAWRKGADHTPSRARPHLLHATGRD